MFDNPKWLSLGFLVLIIYPKLRGKEKQYFSEWTICCLALLVFPLIQKNLELNNLIT